MSAMQFGATTFSRDIAEGDESGWAGYLLSLHQAGFSHVQFLSPGCDKTARMFAKMCDDLGLKRSTLWCTFHPMCPCGTADQAKLAFEQAKITIDRGRIIAGDTEPNLVLSPGMFRGLCDPDKGLVGQDDRAKQLEFVSLVAEYARTISGTKVAAEPLNRCESRGPNTLRAGANLIEMAKAQDVVGLLADSCHQGMEERLIRQAWLNWHYLILCIHASPMSRGLLKEDDDIARTAFAMLQCNANLAGLPIVNESFCRETNPGFFAPLMIHRPLDMTALEMQTENLKWLQEATNPA